MVEVESSDLLKIHDALEMAKRYFMRKDSMNAALHMAENVRYAPLTSTVEAATVRLNEILLANNVDTQF